VFDGQFSNRCYAEAVTKAFEDFARQAVQVGRYQPGRDEILSEQWARIVVHLPYAFQGKRMLPDVFKHDRRDLPMWQEIEAEVGPEPMAENFADAPEVGDALTKAQDQYRRLIANTQQFRGFVENKLEKSQRASSLVGNQYTGSIFLGLMSMLESDYLERADLTGQKVGFCSYGSGAKAKVFEGEVQPGWQEVASRFQLFKRLAARRAIDALVYESLHRGTTEQSVVPPAREFVLVSIGGQGNLAGQRRYAWVD